MNACRGPSGLHHPNDGVFASDDDGQVELRPAAQFGAELGQGQGGRDREPRLLLSPLRKAAT